MRKSSTLSLLLVVLIFQGGCPRKRNLLTVPPVPKTGDPVARARYLELENQYKQSREALAAEFDSLAAEFPADPVVPYATLYSGMSSVRNGDYTSGIAKLDSLSSLTSNPGIIGRGQLYKGIALNYLGDFRSALPILSSAEPAVNPADSQEKAEWLAASASARVAMGETTAALTYYDEWHPIAKVSEKVFIESSIKSIVAVLDENSLREVYGGLRRDDGPLAAFAGDRLATQLSSRGKVDEARSVRNEVEDGLENFALPTSVAESDGGDVSIVGAILPTTGRRNRIGERAARGLLLAAKEAAGRTLELRDSGSDKDTASLAVEELMGRRAIAVVGPMGEDEVERAGATAMRLSIPMVSLSPRGASIANQEAANERPGIFHIVHSAEDRARALARYASKQKVVDFAILRPSNAYGKAVAAAFANEVRRLGGRVVVEERYPPKTTSFKPYVEKMQKPWTAIFVPDQARRLSLVAPALAAESLMPAPLNRRTKTDGPRHILLLSTAELVDDDYLRSAGRYSEGAVFAPGFYPDIFDRDIAPFVDAYKREYGSLPSALEAYAYDAAKLVGAAVTSGAQSRSQVASQIGQLSHRGVTGDVRFSPSGARADAGILFRVGRQSTGEFELRAMK